MVLRSLFPGTTPPSSTGLSFSLGLQNLASPYCTVFFALGVWDGEVFSGEADAAEAFCGVLSEPELRQLSRPGDRLSPLPPPLSRTWRHGEGHIISGDWDYLILFFLSLQSFAMLLSPILLAFRPWSAPDCAKDRDKRIPCLGDTSPATLHHLHVL